MRQIIRNIFSFFSIWIVILICIFSFTLMLSASRSDSAITDELAHIPAGYGYVHNLDYRLNPEHPPLVKVLATLPLLFLQPTFPTNIPSWTSDVNSQWDMGAKFLYESGNDANEIVRTARLMPILLTILLVILIYIWSRELLGNLWGLLPTFLFAFSPTVLAHGHYVTTDVGAAFGVVLATYYFLKFLHESSRKHLLYVGLAFGVAQLTKFSAPLLVPLFIFLIIVFYLAGTMRDWSETQSSARFKRFGLRAWHYGRSLAVIFLIGYMFVVYPVYFLFTANYPISKQAADTEYILSTFANGPTPQGAICHPVRCLADFDIWMSKHYLTRPLAEYMLGILMVIQRSSVGNNNYFLGTVSREGSRLYFPFVYLAKESLPALIMVLFAIVYALCKILKSSGVPRTKRMLDYLGVNFAEFSMFSFIVLYWGYSIKSPLNIGLRHLMPTLPFIYMLTAGVWKKWVMKINLPSADSLLDILKAGYRLIVSSAIKYVILVFLLFWLFLETTFAFPYFLSYFNELAGGTQGGYRYVTDSNYDWGQDFLRLQKFVEAHPEINKIAVDYFGGGNPKYYLGAKEENWWSARGNPNDSGIHWLAVSINTLEGATQPVVGDLVRKPEDEYRWLTDLRPAKPGLGNVPEPDFRVGTSIFVYKL